MADEINNEQPPFSLDGEPRVAPVGDAAPAPVRSAEPSGRFGIPATPPGGHGYGGADYAATYDQHGGGEFHLTDYLRVVYKRRWTAITVFVIIFGLVAASTFTATPMYVATVQILIESDNPNVVNFEEVLQQNQRVADYHQTQYRLLRSRVLARRTIESEKLWDHPQFTGAADSGISFDPIALARGAVGLVAGLFAGRPSEQEARGADETQQHTRAIDRFLSGVAVSPIRNSRLVDVSFTSSDPDFAQRVINALARSYIDQNLEFRFTASREAAEFLGERMAEQRQALEQSELALQRYREQTDSVSLEDRQNIIVQRLSDLNVAFTRARTERQLKEENYNQIRAVQNDPEKLDSVPAVLGSSFIQELKSQLGSLQREQAQLSESLGERHPKFQAVRTAIRETEQKLQIEVAKVVQASRSEYEAALAHEKQLNSDLNAQKAEALELNRQSIEYGVLRRDAESNRKMFDDLMQRNKETDISSELRTSNIRIVDPAERPRRPASPNKTMNLLLGFASGSFFGIVLAFFFEYLDGRIKSPDEIKTHLGLPFLGLVPALDVKTIASGAPLVNNGVPSHFAEAFRTIRTNILFSSTDGGSKSVIVTSTAPGEGKSLVSSNLALAIAMAGQRVLLIDADMRRPRIHELFELPHEPGLSNVMVGDAKASEAVRRTSVPHLWVMAAGKQPPNPAELLGSKRFKDFLATLGEHFDWVILDSPPVMAVTDAAVVSHLTTGVVFVVGSEMTGRGAAKAALEHLDAAKAKYIGAVLNNVDVDANPYYYSHYYSRGYRKYYGYSKA